MAVENERQDDGSRKTARSTKEECVSDREYARTESRATWRKAGSDLVTHMSQNKQ